MKYKQLKGSRSFVLRLNKGEEVISSIEKFAKQQELNFASVQIIGAVEDINLGYLKLNEPENDVIKHSFQGSHEFLATGNISLKEGKHSAHIHAFIGALDKKLFGGILSQQKCQLHWK